MKHSTHYRPSGLAVGAILVFAFVLVVAVALSGGYQDKSHAAYLRDTYQIAADYVDAMDVLDSAPPEVGLALAISAERVLSGPEDVQRMIARGEYRAVRARIRSMRRDLAEIQAYRASL